MKGRFCWNFGGTDHTKSDWTPCVVLGATAFVQHCCRSSFDTNLSKQQVYCTKDPLSVKNSRHPFRRKILSQSKTRTNKTERWEQTENHQHIHQSDRYLCKLRDVRKRLAGEFPEQYNTMYCLLIVKSLQQDVSLPVTPRHKRSTTQGQSPGFSQDFSSTFPFSDDLSYQVFPHGFREVRWVFNDTKTYFSQHPRHNQLFCHATRTFVTLHPQAFTSWQLVETALNQTICKLDDLMPTSVPQF